MMGKGKPAMPTREVLWERESATDTAKLHFSESRFSTGDKQLSLLPSASIAFPRKRDLP